MAVEEIDVYELAQRLGSVTLVDVREPDEYVAAHAPGAMLVPLGTVQERLGELRALGPLHLICAVGARSMRAAVFLDAAGIECTNIAGGTKAWIAAGETVITGDQPT